jgi:hypothetical protein
LRHQLFDFHAVVNRTLVYGSLTSALALIYYGMVGLLQQVLHPIAGTSSYAIVGSTITVSVMFRPARSRIQSVIDQRFYRKRYNAAQTLESFSMRLRDEIDLGTLEKELLAVVQGTMQPVQASLLLLQPTSGNPEHQVTS